MESADINIRGIIAIQNHGGSGTMFLQSLLDNHPEILSLPALYGRELIRFWHENPFTDLESFVLKFVTSPYHAYWFCPDPTRYIVVQQHGLHLLGENRNENIAISLQDFGLHFARELHKRGPSIRGYLISVYVAYALTKGYNYKKDCWINFPFHQNPPEYAQILADNFFDVRFIHMVREPIQCLASGISFESKQQTGRLKHYWADWLVTPNSGASPLVEADHVQSCAIKLEDLHAKPELTMRALSRWLNIEWNPVLLQSTFDGKKWWNRPGLLAVNGFSKSFTEFKGHDIIPKFDRFRLEFLFTVWKKTWNYKLPNYVEKSFYEKIARILMLIPFKIDFLPYKIPSSMEKISYFKLLFIDPYNLDKPTGFIKKCLLPFINLFKSIKNMLSTYRIQQKYLKIVWQQRKAQHNHVRLLPIDEM